MTKSQFRKILLLYIFVTLLMGVVGGYYGYKTGQSMPDIHEKMMTDKVFAKNVEKALESTVSLKQVSSLVNNTAVILGLVSWVGLYVLWAPARVIFIFSLIATYFIAPVVNARLVEAMESEQFSSVAVLMHTPTFELSSQIMLAISAFMNGALFVILVTNLSKSLFEKDHEF